MLAQGYGLPCWEPRPLDPQAQPQGVVPGDVGTYTAESGFRRTFNLFDDARTIQGITQRTRGSPGNECCNPRAKLSHHLGILGEGDVCVHGSSLKPRAPDQKGAVFEFRRDSDAPAGAILVSVSSADEERSDDIKGMGEYIRQHAEAIYRHAFSIRPIGKQESLYIVTGCIKSDSWATAVYRQGMDANHGATLLLVPAVEASSGHPPQYEWTMQGSSRARAGWSDREGVKDQCLFLQGFKVAFSPSFRSRVSSRCSGGDHAISPALLQAQRGEGHQDQAVALRQGPRFSDRGEQRSPHTRTIPGSRRLLSSKNSDTAHTNNTHGILCTPFPPRSQTVYHPSDAINAWFLQQPGCDIAICHDDSWRFFFKSCSSQRVTQEIPSEEDRSKTTDDLGHRAFKIQNGVAFLLPNTCQAEQTILHKTNVFENPTASSSQRLCSSDVVVLVMGIVGAGRSTFINSLLPAKHEDRKLPVGHGLDSCTTTTKCVVLESQDLTEVLGVEKDHRLVLVDTPGLDWSAERKLDPEAVREDIMKWSNRWYVLELFRG
ncbi:hypothetical protein FA13DRAFT_115783 [Coprinellus micaceus]|uniref:Uncharacterized protein n=1 Tax=Coprinellus micaceus TaxID=71717 RepID=A0A4Y7TI53_COPMI|nr:hypothetical protein FA13DRAFT_115783 [Coprinellus micaceus]